MQKICLPAILILLIWIFRNDDLKFKKKEWKCLKRWSLWGIKYKIISSNSSIYKDIYPTVLKLIQRGFIRALFVFSNIIDDAKMMLKSAEYLLGNDTKYLHIDTHTWPLYNTNYWVKINPLKYAVRSTISIKGPLMYTIRGPP